LQWKKSAALFLLAIFTMLPLALITTPAAATSLEVSVFASPTRIHKGENTTLTIKIQQAPPNQNLTFRINVTDPLGASSAAKLTIETDNAGSGNASITYWGDFPEANTSYVGKYSVNVQNATTNAMVAATSFYVEVWLVQIWAGNLANEPIENLLIKVQNNTFVPEQFSDLSASANKTGWTSFLLATGEYTAEAFWKKLPVGSLHLNVINDNVTQVEGWVQLSNLKLTVIEKISDTTVPFVKIQLKYGNITETLTTNVTGVGFVRNLFVDVNYTVEIQRYGLQRSLPPIKLQDQSLNEILVELPTYELFVQVKDAKQNPASGIEVRAYEWGSGLSKPANLAVTDSNGNATIPLALGKYRIRAYDNATLLGETIVNLNQTAFLPIYLTTYKIDFTVEVVDHLGQPVPNAIVKVTRRETEAPLKAATNLNGKAVFSNALGGDSRISVYIRGRLSDVQEVHLTNSMNVRFRLDRYVIVAGYALEFDQFVTVTAMAAFIVLFSASQTHSRFMKILRKGG
jgi:hypothetical protein